MGLGCRSGYTGMMASCDPKRLESADLSVLPERGEISNGRGETTRLGPVNAKVLTVLMSRAGQVVSRAELFDAVWTNQVVGDDTLTRSISDIRAELGRLSAHERLIETLPKRGYRWTAAVREASGLTASNTAPSAPSGREGPAQTNAAQAGNPAAPPRRRPAVLGWLVRGAGYVAALGLVASLAVWLADALLPEAQPVVAVLPITADASLAEPAADVEQALMRYLIGLDSIDLLAPSAVASRPGNPFPYFYYEFGASWVIEDELKSLSRETELALTLVDARTGIVLFQATAPVPDERTPTAEDLEPAFGALAAFFGSNAPH